MPLPSFSASIMRELLYELFSGYLHHCCVSSRVTRPQGFQKVIWGDFIKCKMFLDITGAMM